MEAREYIYVKRKIIKLLEIDLDCYKTKQMQRRLRSYLLRTGYPHWPAYFRAIQDDVVQLGKLRDYLTINVTRFLRDPEKFELLRETILPELLRGRPKLNVWSAGCSRGQEPYSLAMLLAEATSPYRQHQILATDIDHSALGWAQAGGPYQAEELSDVPPGWLETYFNLRDDGYWFTHRLQRKIAFRQHNLLSDPVIMPEKEHGDGFDLIVCRNVVIYFTKEIKEQLYQRFYNALVPGGMLFLGGTEIISKATEFGFEVVNMSFYRRNHV